MTERSHQPLDRADARALTDRIQAAAEPWPLLIRVYRGDAWRVLGYRTWRAYCDNEFKASLLWVPRSQRPGVVLWLAGEGMSTRAIAAAIGVGRTTIARVLSGSEPSTPRTGHPHQGASAAQEALDADRPAWCRDRVSSATPADQVVPNLVSNLRGMCQVIDGYELDPATDREQAAAWGRDLSASVAVLRRFTFTLKEYSRAE
ncbi:hypothetical protein AGRA3207_000213 [Actinomadura graeca]|uniref:Uncharacterized protein n=1 Tax=Actinomadura graeca TaxID=2750812 RepID=A0ABX8QMH7_9ACTN|nr:hypothetical protein [Actinomadura graeca]QXJ19650.1 hypothetical protein AGRA3207_000213 [Actinomadura graeca]